MVDPGNLKLGIHCSRWRNYDVTFDWLKLEWVYSKRDARSSRYPICENAGTHQHSRKYDVLGSRIVCSL